MQKTSTLRDQNNLVLGGLYETPDYWIGNLLFVVIRFRVINEKNIVFLLFSGDERYTGEWHHDDRGDRFTRIA